MSARNVTGLSVSRDGFLSWRHRSGRTEPSIRAELCM